MTIDQPRKHPQAQAFHDAAAVMREARYFRTEILEEQIEITHAMAAVATEVAYFFDHHRVLDPIALEAYRRASYLQVPGLVEMSAEVLLTFSLEAATRHLAALRDL